MKWIILMLSIAILWHDGKCDMEAHCLPGWEFRFGSDQCYKGPVTDWRKTFNDAREYCQGYVGDSLMIKDQKTKDWVTSTLASEEITQLVYLNAKNVNNEWKWLEDDTEVDTTLLPLADTQNGNCGTLTSGGRLRGENCSVTHLFMCHRDIDLPPNCDYLGDWEEFLGHCYFSSREKMTWNDSLSDCESAGGSLITINDDTEQEFAKYDSHHKGTNVWIGMSEMGHAGDFKWIDGDKSNFTFWEGDEPSKKFEGRGAGAIDNENKLGKWVAADGASDTLDYLCEKEQGACVYGWESFQDSCYYINTEPTDVFVWENANATCEEVGAHLLIINNEEENDFIKENVAPNDPLWIGLKSQPQVDFYWIDESVMNFTHMTDEDKQEALDSKDEKCVFFQVTNPDTGDNSWTPIDCRMPRHYICEIKQGDPLHLIHHPTEKYCPDGWLMKDDFCYLLSQEEKNWADARKFCNDNSANLISINSWAEQDFIHCQLTGDMFIGYTDEVDEGTWKWSDSTSSDVVNWHEGEPNGGRESNCGVMYILDGTWDDWYCDRTRIYGCERAASDTPFGPVSSTTTEEPPYSENCGGFGWVENTNTGECYYINLEASDYYSADYFCQCLDYSTDVRLLSLSTPEEHTFVIDWLQERHVSQQIFTIGMQNSYASGNAWDDGSPVRFFDWADGEPNGAGYEECVQMYTESGTWNDFPCTDTYPSICEKKGPNYVPIEPPPPLEPVCPEGWMFFNMHCYYFYDTKVTWNTAQAWCESHLNSSLASIVNDAENNFLNGIAGSKDMDLWVGLHDDNTGNDWHWVDGSNMDEYANWNDTQPDDYGGHEHCGQLRPQLGGHWNDLGCDVSNSFVCKITIDVCPQGWTYHEKKCYFACDLASPNDEARKKCKEFNTNADLVTLNNEEENSFFADIMPHGPLSVWIGYKYNTDTQSWHWDDGSSANYTHWNDGEPNNMDTEHCTESIDAKDMPFYGKWNNLNCDETRNFGCEYFPKHYLGCEDQWMFFDGSCYFFPQDSYYSTYSFEDAQDSCAQLDAQLVSIHSAEENDFILSNIDPTSYNGYWIGATDTDHLGDMAWVDGTTYTYSNWNYLTVYQLYEPRCGLLGMYGATIWEIYSCTTQYSSYICKKAPEAIEIDPTESGCRDGDLHHKGSCYSVPKNKLSWDEAKNACEANGTHLVRIEDEQEGAFFSANLGDYGSDAWTDVKVHRYEDQSIDFIFDDGKLVTFLPWDANQPDVSAGDCIFITGTLGSSGFYKVSQCETQMNFVCEYDRQGYTTPIPEPTPTHGTFCYDGWTHNAGHCYQVFSDPVTWGDGEVSCQSYGGHLASINSQDEENAIIQLLWYASLGPYVSSLWVGLQLDTEADKHWTDGSSIDFLNWESDQPILHDHENCASADKNSLQLACTVCESHLPYICEALEGSMISTLAPPTFQPPSKCDDGVGDWYLFNDHCYKFVSEVDEDPQSWEKSNQLCEAEGSFLTSVVDIDENYFIESMIYQFSDESMWIGGRATEDSGWEWLDGSPFSYESWAAGEPNHSMDQEDCIEMYNLRKGKWNDKNCGHLNGRVCKRPNGATLSTPQPTLPPAGNCPEGWVHVGTTGRCFLFSDTVTYFDDATQACKDLHPKANLASIHTPKEMAYITAGIGMLEKDAWIGLKREMDEYVWVDQTTVDYTPWAPGEPNGQYMGEDCTESLYPSGKMNDISCYDMNGYICAMTQDPSITEPSSFPKCGAPYDNYFHYLDDCYRAEKTAKTWQEAEQTCVDEGSHLASAYSVNENAFLWILAQDGNTLHPWIGLNNLRDSKIYDWSDNWPVFYTNWGDNQPTVNTTDQNCVRINSADGLWYNEKCDGLRPFLCKHSEDVAPTADPPLTGHCPDGPWIDLKGAYCYMAVEDQKTWNDANGYCAFRDSNLTSIHSDVETVLLQHLIEQLNSDIWIGLIKKKSGLGWSDGTAYDYLNWDYGEPSTEDEKCTVFYAEDGKWNDLNCDNLQPFVCKTRKIPDVEPTDPPIPTTVPPFVDTTTTPGGGGGGNTLSGGAIFGIVFSVLVVFAAVGFVGVSYIKKKQVNSGSFNTRNTSTARLDLSNISAGTGTSTTKLDLAGFDDGTDA